jgi:hypothetical protein
MKLTRKKGSKSEEKLGKGGHRAVSSDEEVAIHEHDKVIGFLLVTGPCSEAGSLADAEDEVPRAVTPLQ